jgi:hypothetical protein
MRLCGYRREWLVLALIALGTLPLLSVESAQDSSRLAVTEQIVLRGKVNIDPYWKQTIDRAFADGHWYSDKAPGVALLAVPAVEISRAVDAVAKPSDRHKAVWLRAWTLWGLRIWAGGVAFLGLAWLLGRVAEGLVAGAGAVTAAVFGVGTMAGSLGPTTFGHLPDALALFAAFVLGTRARRPRDWLWVGLLAGIGVLFEYPAGIAALILLVFAALRGGRRAAAWTIAGGVPAAIVLGGYDWVAFGAPWRLSYRYTDNMFTQQQTQNFFGVGLPTGHGIWTLLFDGHGLIEVSPVLLAAAAGLVSYWRRDRVEAAVAIAIPVVFFFYTAGYFLPNGGLSPGPRFAAAALPFLLLGLPFALARWRVVTLFLSALSIGLGLFDELTWSVANRLDFLAWPATVWSLIGTSRHVGCYILLTTGAAAGIVALAGAIGTRFQERPEALLQSQRSTFFNSVRRGRKGAL